MAECLTCGRKLNGQQRKYCSKQCANIALNEIHAKSKYRKFVLNSRSNSSFTLDDYGKWCRERDRQGLPWVSYGKLQTKRYFEKQKGGTAK